MGNAGGELTYGLHLLGLLQALLQGRPLGDLAELHADQGEQLAQSLGVLDLRRDIETIQRIKTLLYEEGFTIAGAKKKLEQEMKEQTKGNAATPATKTPNGEDKFRDEVKEIKAELHGILDMLDRDLKTSEK